MPPSIRSTLGRHSAWARGQFTLIPVNLMQKQPLCSATWARGRGVAWGIVARYGDTDFALQLALQKGKCAASVRHDCKATVSDGGPE
jgi:hypothetical protein